MRSSSKVLARLLLSSGVFASAAPALAAPSCAPLKIVAALELKRLPTGRPAIAATIDGKPQVLMVDTGAAFSTLNPETVRDLKLTPTRGGQNVRTRIVGVSGASSDEVVRLPSIEIGNLKQEGAYFFVAPRQNGRVQFTGAIGPDFLENFDADFDFAARKLNLISPEHCDGQVVYWQAGAIAVVPIELDRVGHISFRMLLDGKRLNAQLDTGSTTTLLNLDVARREFDVKLDAPDVKKAGELRGNFTAATYRRQFKSLAFEGVTVANPEITMIPNMMNLTSEARNTGSLIRERPTGLPDLILGMNTLGRLHLYIAYHERKLYITAANPRAGAGRAE